MIPLVEIPVLVRHFAPYFESVFSPEAFVHFQRYISGLVLSENKTVDGINRIFVTDTRNQSSVNRWLNASNSRRRIGLLINNELRALLRFSFVDFLGVFPGLRRFRSLSGS